MKSLSLCFLLLFPLGLFSQNPYPDTLKRKQLALLIGVESAAYVGGMAYLQYIWYRDQDRVPFHWYNDNAGYLQIDKFGHAYGAYLESYLGYHALRQVGVKRKPALLFGATLGLVLQTPIEVFDGIYEGWGFSWGDMAANAAGPALIVGQELLFQEQIIRYKFSFSRSPYADQAPGYLGDNALESLFYDYNGHTYWLSVPANRLFLKDRLPDWLCLSVGYSANGMFGEFENRSSWAGQPIPPTDRYRQWLFSLDIDASRIHTRHRWLNRVLDGLGFIKVPFPTLEFNSLGKFRAYGFYF
jgi:hypothetical protein